MSEQSPKISLFYGTDPFEAAQHLLKANPLWEDWESTAAIGLKPNLVVSKTADSGATTHPDFTAGVISFLQDRGFSNLTILEGSWVGDSTERAFRVCGYQKGEGVPHLRPDGEVKRLTGNVGESPIGHGIGDCLSGCSLFVRGCPPTVKGIGDFLD